MGGKKNSIWLVVNILDACRPRPIINTGSTGGDGNGTSEEGKGKRKEDLKVSGFFHAPLAGHTTESRASPPFLPPRLLFQTYPQPYHTLTV